MRSIVLPQAVPDRDPAAHQRADPAVQGLLAGLHPRASLRRSVELTKYGRDLANQKPTRRRSSSPALCYLMITIPLGYRGAAPGSTPGEGHGDDLPTRPGTPIEIRRAAQVVRRPRGAQGHRLHVDAGEVVCVIGPSGSGKSTLLRCVNLLEQPTVGHGHRRRRRGHRPATCDIDAVRRRIGMVFQQFNLFPHLTVLQQRHARPATGADAVRGGGREDRPRQPRAGRARRQGRRLPGAALGRPAAARGDRPGAGDGPGR